MVYSSIYFCDEDELLKGAVVVREKIVIWEKYTVQGNSSKFFEFE